MEKKKYSFLDNGTKKVAYYWPVYQSAQLGKYLRQHGGGFGTQN